MRFRVCFFASVYRKDFNSPRRRGDTEESKGMPIRAKATFTFRLLPFVILSCLQVLPKCLLCFSFYCPTLGFLRASLSPWWNSLRAQRLRWINPRSPSCRKCGRDYRGGQDYCSRCI